jgi:hypothetical protein
MTEYGTIKLPRSEYERHNEERKKNKQTWAEYIDGQAPISNNAEVDVEEIARAVTRQTIINTEDKRHIGQELETVIDGYYGPEQLANEVSRQIDYAQLAGQVASELEGRMR